jgi:hypothetical protein
MNRLAWMPLAAICLLPHHGDSALAEQGAAEEQAISRLERLGVRVWRDDKTSGNTGIEVAIFLCPMDKVSVKDFAPIRQLKSLRKVKLTGSRINDEYVEQLSGCTKLEIIELVDTRITDRSLAILGQLKNLRQVILAFCPGVTDRGIMELGKLSELEAFVLTDAPNVTGTGLAALQTATKLRELDLSWSPITDEGVKVLGKHPALQKLVLEECPISDKSLKVIETMPQLRQIVVDGTKITKAGIESLQKARPGLIVKH